MRMQNRSPAETETDVITSGKQQGTRLVRRTVKSPIRKSISLTILLLVILTLLQFYSYLFAVENDFSLSRIDFKKINFNYLSMA